MILTESDLHAYNRGELPPDAVRQLEDDPLAMQDAARLRAISEALRDEQPITVSGRAETLERLRKGARSRVGVSPWVWATGTACVVGLTVISVPRTSLPQFGVRQVVFSAGESTTAASMEATPAAEVAGTAAASPSMKAQKMAAPETRARAPFATADSAAEPQSQERATSRHEARAVSIDLQTDDITRTKESLETLVTGRGGVLRATSYGRKSSASQITQTFGVPHAEIERVLDRVRGLGDVLAEASSSANLRVESARAQTRVSRLQAERFELLKRDGAPNGDKEKKLRAEAVSTELTMSLKVLEHLQRRAKSVSLRVTLTQRPEPRRPRP